MIQVRVKLFTVLREGLGKDSLDLELPEGTTCAEVISRLGKESANLLPILKRSFLAINGLYADSNAFLSTGDELAVLPPVSGG